VNHLRKMTWVIPLINLLPGSSTAEHSAVNRRVASSNLARGAKFSFFVN
jgi:hypothetical protein